LKAVHSTRSGYEFTVKFDVNSQSELKEMNLWPGNAPYWSEDIISLIAEPDAIIGPLLATPKFIQ